MRWGEKLMEEEQVILSEPKVYLVRLDPKGGGRRFLQSFSWILGGEILRRHLRGQFVKELGETQLELRDIKDLMNKWRKNACITLTNYNLILTWKQGTISKKNKTLVLPLTYMSSIKKPGKIDYVCIDFEIPTEDKGAPLMFTLDIMFSSYQWSWRGKQEKGETWMN